MYVDKVLGRTLNLEYSLAEQARRRLHRDAGAIRLSIS